MSIFLGLAVLADWLLFSPWERTRGRHSKIGQALLRAGVTAVSPGRFMLICLASGLVYALLTLGLTVSWLFACVFAIFGVLPPTIVFATFPGLALLEMSY